MSQPRILVVDDEASLAEFLSLLFAGQGYNVTTAGSLGEARARLAEGSPDLVLCDILMPDGNGLELLREIKTLDPRVSVVMMTAYTSTKSALDAMKLAALPTTLSPGCTNVRTMSASSSLLPLPRTSVVTSTPSMRASSRAQGVRCELSG